MSSSDIVRYLIGDLPLLRWHSANVVTVPEVAVVLAWCVALARRRVDWDRLRTIPLSARYGMGCLLLAAIVSTIHASEVLRAAAALKAWFFFPMLAAVLIITTRSRVVAYQILVGLGLIQVLLGIDQLRTLGIHERMSGTLSSPNHFVMVVGPALVAALLLARSAATPQKYAWWTLAGVMVVGVLGSQSVGGLMGLLLAGSIAAWATSAAHIRRILVGILVSISVVAAAGIWARLATGQANSVRSRVEIWQVAYVLGTQQPLTGIGMRDFPGRYSENVVPIIGHTPIEWNVPEPHNLWLGMWVETGVLGLIGICLLAYSLFRRKGAPLAGLSFVVLLGHGLVDTPYFYLIITYVFWLSYSATWAGLQDSQTVA